MSQRNIGSQSGISENIKCKNILNPSTRCNILPSINCHNNIPYYRNIIRNIIFLYYIPILFSFKKSYYRFSWLSRVHRGYQEENSKFNFYCDRTPSITENTKLSRQVFFDTSWLKRFLSIYVRTHEHWQKDVLHDLPG